MAAPYSQDLRDRVIAAVAAGHRRAPQRLVSASARARRSAGRNADGIRALDKGKPCAPASVERYLRARFGDGYEAARDAMARLAAAKEPRDLALHGFRLYERFRPEVPEGVKGWGAAGELDLGKIEALAG